MAADEPELSHRPPPHTGGRRFAAGCAAGGVVAVVAFAWMVTGGTFQFFQSGLNTDFYDVQARALLAGHWWMPPKVLSIEGIVEGHHTFMYYGPVPALLRIPVLLLTHRFDGRLTEVSMLLAFVVGLVALCDLAWRLRRRVLGDRPVTGREQLLAAAMVVTCSLGSNLFFLASDPFIYHEAELWGAVLALASFDLLVGFLDSGRLRPLAGAGVLATASILTRGSVGAGPVAALGLVAAVHFVAWLRHRTGWEGESGLGRFAGVDDTAARLATVALLACSVLLPVGLYAWINEVKFHTLFSLPLGQQVETMISAHRRATLAANGGSLFGLKFVPTALVAYLRPDALVVTRLFPFLMFPDAATVIGHVRYDDRDWASSLTATMPFLTLLAVAGGVFAIRRPARSRAEGRKSPLALLRAPAAGASVGTVGVLTIAFLANRYLADAMPLVLLLAAGGWQLVAGRLGPARSAPGEAQSAAGGPAASERRRPAGPRRRALRAVAGVVLVASGLFSIWANTALGLVYQRELRPAVPLGMRAGFVSFQQHLDEALFGNPAEHVVFRTSLRRHAPAGTLAIVGHCAGLYESAGLSSGWDAVERSQAEGHFRLSLVLPPPSVHGWLPVLSNGIRGQAAWLAVRTRGPGEYQFGYLFEGPGQYFVVGSSFPATPGRRVVVDAVLDPLVGEITASVDGTVEYELGYFVRPNRPIALGRNPYGGPVAARFPGRVRELPVTTPLCDYVLSRLGGR